jgi:hypothetical protein
MLSVAIKPVLLSVVMINVVMLNVVKLNVGAPSHGQLNLTLSHRGKNAISLFASLWRHFENANTASHTKA